MLINPTLDKALAGIGGIPRGRLIELLGAPTLGMATLALKIMAEAQAAKDVAAYMDLSAIMKNFAKQIS
jgi:recombination protein RecA